MSANERRNEIMRILLGRRHETMRRLAEELGVRDRTIRTDITVLTIDYPLETFRGNGGGVKLADWYRPHRGILSGEQQRVLYQMIDLADEHQSKVLRELLNAYDSQKKKQRGDDIMREISGRSKSSG